MKRHLQTLVVIGLTAATCSAATIQKKHTTKKPATKKAVAAKIIPVTARQENQFVTVDEFVKIKKASKTVVSVEGYVVEAYTTGSNVTLMLVDSVDHVLSAKDADSFARAGATCTVPPNKKSNWALSAKGLHKIIMYTGKGHAETALNDTPAKIRITGLVAGRGIISPVTNVEYQNDNGDLVLF